MGWGREGSVSPLRGRRRLPSRTRSRAARSPRRTRCTPPPRTRPTRASASTRWRWRRAARAVERASCLAKVGAGGQVGATVGATRERSRDRRAGEPLRVRERAAVRSVRERFAAIRDRLVGGGVLQKGRPLGRAAARRAPPRGRRRRRRHRRRRQPRAARASRHRPHHLAHDLRGELLRSQLVVGDFPAGRGGRTWQVRRSARPPTRGARSREGGRRAGRQDRAGGHRSGGMPRWRVRDRSRGRVGCLTFGSW